MTQNMTEPNHASRQLSRRDLLRTAAVATTAAVILPATRAMAEPYPSKRPAPAQRKFRSKAVDAAIASVSAKIADPELAWLFANCLPNTLDTTVEPGTYQGKPDTVVVTGDINAMWLRDSSAQVYPYLPFLSSDTELATLIQGVIHRQARCILIDSYANAFMANLDSPEPLDWSRTDTTKMTKGVGERKWEVDSLCYTVRLAHRYWKETRDTTPFDDTWHHAQSRILATFREQQRKNGPGPYSFQRTSAIPTDSLPGSGFGNPTRPIGLIHAGFRPSDDACIYPFNIPGNFFAVQTLHRMEEMLTEIAHDTASAREAASLRAEIEAVLKQYAPAQHPVAGRIYAYEIDGFGNNLFMDDANVPSLLALPYLGACSPSDPLYLATRKFVLGPNNPYFFKGTAAEGIGGPHIGQDMIWPMAIIMRALTTEDEKEQLTCLHQLKTTHANTGFMHESFNKDNPAKFTREWFAWANTLFGELILTIDKKSPKLLTMRNI